MTRQLKNALKRQKKQTKQEILQIPGSLGITIGGQKRVDVPNRNSFVYVRLRDNQNELIQAFNNKVAPSYGLPVIVERQGNRYIVVSVDSLRYNNNYNSFAPFLPRHGNTHSFDPETGGGGDPVWVYSRQMMPALIMPSGSSGGPNAILNAYTLKNADGTWKYVGVTGTPNITLYKPINNQAVMVLVYLDSISGNPYLMVGSGSYFANTITGSAAIVPYIPTLINPNHIPLAAVRLVSGTNSLSWDNIYDVRQWLHVMPTGTSSGGGSTGTTISIWDEGIPLGTPSVLNFVGGGVDVSISGSVARIHITGSAGGATTNLTGTSIGLPNSVVLTDSFGFLLTSPWLKWGTSSGEEYVEFGADVVGKETNAGKIGYETFDSGYLTIVGAGTSVGERNIKLYDNVDVGGDFQAASSNLTSPTTYNITGSPHQHSYTDTIGAFLNSVAIPASTTYNGCPFKVGVDAITNSFPWPKGGVLSNMAIRTSASQPASGSLVATLYVNNVATALVVTIAANAVAGTYFDNTNTVTIVAGDILRWVIQNNATAAAANLTSASMALTAKTS